MTALAVAPAAEPAGYEHQVAELVDLEVLVARGLDLQRLRFVPAPSDPLLGYARCPVRGCLNVTEHTATSLCSRCQHRYGRWQRASDGGGLERFLVEATQTRSEDLERVCQVCRTPGHERPAAAQGVCYSCVRQASNRGQSVATYIAGDERWPPATPRPSFGLCRMTCDALACGSDGLCGEHLRHWRRAGRPAGAAFEAWRAQVGEPLPASRYVDLSGLGDRVLWEFLLGLSVAIDEHRRTRISELRRVVSLIGQRNVASIAELDVTGVRNRECACSSCGFRTVCAWRSPIRTASGARTCGTCSVFGKPQAYRVDFTQISQPSRGAALHSRDEAPHRRRRGGISRGIEADQHRTRRYAASPAVARTKAQRDADRMQREAEGHSADYLRQLVLEERARGAAHPRQHRGSGRAGAARHARMP